MITGFGAYGYHIGLISLIQIISEVQAIKAQQANAQENNVAQAFHALSASELFTIMRVRSILSVGIV